jgi:adenylate cyclase class 2
MPPETEIKLKIDDLTSFHRHLKRLGAKTVLPGSGRVHEMNLIFDTPQGGLAKHGQLLRLRTETPASAATKGRSNSNKRPKANAPQRTLLTFKSPPDQLAIGQAASPPPHHGRYKVREEIELVIPDGAPLKKIFEGLGLRGWFRYEKYRTTYHLPARLKWAQNLLIELDETPIGTFVELEGPGPAIDQAAKELGFSSKDFILKNYLVLYLDDCRRRGVPPADMLFPSSHP